MVKLIEPITIKDLCPKILPDTINFFLRGSTFRTTTEDQIFCIKSIFNSLLGDLILNGIKIKIILATYKNNKDNLLTRYLKEKFDGEIVDKRLDPKLFENQSESFIEILRIAKSLSGSTIITRADLKFFNRIPLNRLDKNSFSFQWNHFHDFKIKEVPDQLHFIGENQIKHVHKICKQNSNNLGLLPDNTGYHTLHNLYNVLSSNKVKISYIFDLKNVSYSGTFCNLRGNSHYTKIPHFYEYTTPPPKKNFFKKIRRFFLNKFN